MKPTILSLLWCASPVMQYRAQTSAQVDGRARATRELTERRMGGADSCDAPARSQPGGRARTTPYAAKATDSIAFRCRRTCDAPWIRGAVVLHRTAQQTPAPSRRRRAWQNVRSSVVHLVRFVLLLGACAIGLHVRLLLSPCCVRLVYVHASLLSCLTFFSLLSFKESRID